MNETELKEQRDKSCKDYLQIYIKLEEVKALVRDLIKKSKHEINFDNFTYLSLEHLGDLKQIQDLLEK